jgi:hypothetical protein
MVEAQVVDFALRHVGGGLPPFFWGPVSRLAEIGISLEPDPEATSQLLAGQPDGLTRQVIDQTLDLLATRFPADDETS